MAKLPRVQLGNWSKDLTNLRSVLKQIPEDMRMDILKSAVSDAMEPILTAARSFAQSSVDTGALKNSLTKKVKSYPRKGKVVGLVGPARGYFLEGSKAGKLGAIQKGARKPSAYAHLVEKGHVIAGTSKRVKEKPFLKPAVLTTKAEQLSRFHAGIARGLTNSVRRKPSKK